jgi:hypothetical protein
VKMQGTPAGRSRVGLQAAIELAFARRRVRRIRLAGAAAVFSAQPRWGPRTADTLASQAPNLDPPAPCPAPHAPCPCLYRRQGLLIVDVYRLCEERVKQLHAERADLAARLQRLAAPGAGAAAGGGVGGGNQEEICAALEANSGAEWATLVMMWLALPAVFSLPQWARVRVFGQTRVRAGWLLGGWVRACDRLGMFECKCAGRRVDGQGWLRQCVLAVGKPDCLCVRAGLKQGRAPCVCCSERLPRSTAGLGPRAFRPGAAHPAATSAPT